jgi:hypothetical protein
MTMEEVKQYRPTPQDDETEKWLADETLHEGLYQFDNELEKLLDPIWEKLYIKEEPIPYTPDLPFSSSETTELKTGVSS